MKRSFLLLALASLFTINGYSLHNKSQNISEQNQPNNNLITLEQNLILQFKKMQDNPESSQAFAATFYQMIKDNPKSLSYSFKKLQEETDIRIVTSSDKNLRIYSWDNNDGGTMRFFDQLIQLNDNGKINSTLKVASEDAQSFISKIYTLKTDKNETLYLTINNSIFSNKDVSQSIFAYKISNNKLVATKAFRTKKQSLSSIHCEYDFFSVVDRPERAVELITLKNNILNIPVINEKGSVTQKKLFYIWNGSHFKYDGVK